MWRVLHGLRSPRGAGPARFSRCWAAAGCCWRQAHSICRCGCSARCWPCSGCSRRSRPRPSAPPSHGSITRRRGGCLNRWRPCPRRRWRLPAQPDKLGEITTLCQALDRKQRRFRRSFIHNKRNDRMPSFHNGAVEIAYLDEGEGDPIVLVHGFASTKSVNWVYRPWVSELKKNGCRVIALDNRGHGDSAKLYDAAQYDIAIMAGDVMALMDHLQIARADIMGYSLGSRMTAVLARSHPQRLRSAILGGIGLGLIEGGGPGE